MKRGDRLGLGGSECQPTGYLWLPRTLWFFFSELELSRETVEAEMSLGDLRRNEKGWPPHKL